MFLLFQLRPVRLLLFAVLLGLGKGTEHGSLSTQIVAGLCALFVIGLLDPRLFPALADGITWLADWVRDRV